MRYFIITTFEIKRKESPCKEDQVRVISKSDFQHSSTVVGRKASGSPCLVLSEGRAPTWGSLMPLAVKISQLTLLGWVCAHKETLHRFAFPCGSTLWGEMSWKLKVSEKSLPVVTLYRRVCIFGSSSSFIHDLHQGRTSTHVLWHHSSWWGQLGAQEFGSWVPRVTPSLHGSRFCKLWTLPAPAGHLCLEVWSMQTPITSLPCWVTLVAHKAPLVFVSICEDMAQLGEHPCSAWEEGAFRHAYVARKLSGWIIMPFKNLLPWGAWVA